MLTILGFSPPTLKPINGVDLEYIKFDANTFLFANKQPTIHPLSVMMVYTDIIEYNLVGDTQAPLLGFIPVTSKFGEQAHWCFNPVYYVPVKENLLSSISIKICTDTGETFPFQNDGKVICRLNFRKRNFLQ